MADPLFFAAYRGRPPWDIGRAQPAFVELANQGLVTGRVLDVGCGTGDLCLEMAERGSSVLGIDVVPRAIDQARAKARLRGLERKARFLVHDALMLKRLRRKFDTVLDCGLFHSFSDPERELYALEVAAVLKPGGMLHILCFSDWEDHSWGGPRRVSQAEIIDTFREHFRVEDIQEARFLVLPGIPIRGHAWLASLVREADKVTHKPKRRRVNRPETAPTVLSGAPLARRETLERPR